MLSTANFPGASLRHLGYATLLIPAIILARLSITADAAPTITAEKLLSTSITTDDTAIMQIRPQYPAESVHRLSSITKTDDVAHHAAAGAMNRTVVFENVTGAYYELAKNETVDKKNEQSTVENWCVIWYLGAFGSLVCFFLIITCTELFFGNPLYRRENLEAYVQQFHTSDCHKPWKPSTPPPPYHLFAPPGYKETMKKYKKQQSKLPQDESMPQRQLQQQQQQQQHQLRINSTGTAPLANVYIIPVHNPRNYDRNNYDDPSVFPVVKL